MAVAFTPSVGAPIDSPAPSDLVRIDDNPPVVRNDGATLPTETTDSPGGPSPSPGSVISTYVSPPAVQSSLPGNIVPPHTEETNLAITYATVVGTYEFPKATPYLTKYVTNEGEVLVVGSTFVVLSQGIVPFVNSTVTEASDYRYQARYGLLNGTEPIGNVTVAYDFRDDGPPKITAILNRSGDEDLSLSWLSLTADTVAFNGTTSIDFASVSPPVPIETAAFRIAVGPDIDTVNWTRRLILNWSDALAGSASVGTISAAGLSGPGVRVHRFSGVTMDNRRLVAFQMAGKPIPVTYVDDIPQWMIRGSGSTIRIRGVGMWDPWRGLY